MRRVPPFTVFFALLVLGSLVVGACRVGDSLPTPIVAPTRPPAVTAMAPVGPLSPTKAPPPEDATAAPAPTQPASPTFPVGPVDWTLIILHTGEVYGDVLPCG